MALDSSLLLKVKEHVKTKLKTIGAFIDEELPDYIMVMVANKKNEASMTNDLHLFLGDHAAEFTKWLHQTLNSLQCPSREPSKEKDSSHASSKSKSSGKRKTSKTHSPERRRSQKSETSSRSRSPLQSRRTEKKELHSREPHAEPELLNIHLEENDFTSEDISSTANIQEERKVVSTSSRTPSSDGTRETAGLRSVIQVKKAEKRSRPACVDEKDHVSSRLLKLAFEDVRSTTSEKRKPVEVDHQHQSDNRRRPISRTVACPDVSSSNSNVTSTAVDCEPETRFYVTLSGSTDVSSSHGAAGSDEENVPKSSVPTTFDVPLKARLGKRRILPYSAEEHQRVSHLSTSVNPTCRSNVRDRLGPLIHSQSKQPFMPQYAKDDVELNDDLEGYESVEIAEEPTEEYSGIEPGRLASSAAPFRAISTTSAATANSKLRLIDRLNQRQLMVNLNDVKGDTVPNAEGDAVTAVPRSVSLSTAGDTDSKNGATVENGRTLPNTLKRCKFWPHCRNADKCAFIHPSQECSAFPRCGPAATCTFVHPACRFGALCRRKDCAYDHSVPPTSFPAAAALSKPSAAVPVTVVDKVPCRYGKACTRPHCPYYHPPKVVPTSTSPANASVAISPVPCRYGSACTNRPKCPFLHLDLPRPDQLKWRAAGKDQPPEQKGTNSASVTAVANAATLGKPLPLTS